MKRNTLSVICIFLITCLMVIGCKKKETPVKIAKPQMTEEQVRYANNIEIKLLRYEQDLFMMDKENMAAEFESLYGMYPENIVAKDAWKNKEMLQSIKSFVSDPIIKEIYKDTQLQYADMDWFRQEITPALTLYLTHFPSQLVPNFCTLISGIDFQMPQVFGYENTIFICLDMYLGKDYKHYAQAGMPKYIAARCDKKYMLTDCFSKALVYRHLPDKTLVTLLDNMVDAGKKMIFTQTMFPTTPRKTSSNILKNNTNGQKRMSQPFGITW